MKHAKFTLTDARSKFAELIERAAAGEEVIITRYGRPVARLLAPEQPRAPLDKTQLKRLTDSQPQQTEPASRFMPNLRKDARY